MRTKTLNKKPVNPNNAVTPEPAAEAEPEMFGCVLARDPVTGRVKPVCGPKLSPAEMRALLLAQEAADAEHEAAKAETDGEDDAVEADCDDDDTDEVRASGAEELDGEEQEEVEPPVTRGPGARRRSR